MKENQNDYELLYLIEQEDEDAKIYLYQKYGKILTHFAHQFYITCKSINGTSYEDFYQEACYGFEKAIANYDDKKNILFYTYVVTCIKNQLRLYRRSITRKRDYPLNTAISLQEASDSGILYEDLIKSNELQPYEICEKHEQEDIIRSFQNDLPFLEACIFELRYNDFKYREISNLLDVPVHKITHIIEKIKDVGYQFS